VGIIVLGGHIQSLGIIRIFGRLDIPGIIIDNTSRNLARHSIYCKKFYKIKDENLLDFLIELDRNNRYKSWVVFPTNDFHVKLLSLNKDRLQQNLIISTDSWEVIQKFYNKRHTYQLAARLGIPIPGTFFPPSAKDLEAIDINYPCIVKPAVMVDFYKKVKKKVFICKNKDELKSFYNKALTIIPAEEIIIQEIIPGSSENQYSACFLYLKKHAYIYLSACRMRQHPIDFGNATTYAELMEVPDIRNYAETLLYETNYNGLCEVEFKKDERDGVFKFLEVNPRTWKWHSIANKSGTPFLKTYFDFLNGHEINATEGYKKASFVHWLTDFPVRLKLLLKGYKFWNRLITPCENAVWAKDDLKPWVFEKLYVPYFILSR